MLDEDDWKVIVAAVIFVVLTAGPLPAAAQQQSMCMPAQQATRLLEEQYGEGEAGWGLTPDGKRLMQWFTFPGGSWVVVVTVPGGNTCMLFGGDRWYGDAPLARPGERS